MKPMVSDTMAAGMAITGPKIMAPRAVASMGVWMYIWGPTGMAKGFRAMRSATNRAVITSIRVSFSSAAASRQ